MDVSTNFPQNALRTYSNLSLGLLHSRKAVLWSCIYPKTWAFFMVTFTLYCLGDSCQALLYRVNDRDSPGATAINVTLLYRVTNWDGPELHSTGYSNKCHFTLQGYRLRRPWGYNNKCHKTKTSIFKISCLIRKKVPWEQRSLASRVEKKKTELKIPIGVTVPKQKLGGY